MRFRLNSSDTGAPEKRVESLLDLGNESISQKDRKAELEKLIIDFVLPHLNKYSTFNGVAKIVSSGKFKGWAVRKNLQDLIESI